MSNHRICRVCWNCGSEDFRKLKPDRMVYFSKDRECTECGVMYTLPMPGIICALLLLVGTVFTAVFGSSVVLLVLAGWKAIQAEEIQIMAFVVITMGLFIAAPLAFVGIECLRQGIAGCRQQVTDPVDFSQPKSSLDEGEVKRPFED